MTRRILFVDHAAVLGGGELCLLDIAAGLRSRSAVALFENGPFEALLVDAGVTVLRIDTGNSLKGVKKDSRMPSGGAVMAMLRAAAQLARAAKGFDVLYANSPKSFLACAAAGVIARRPVIWHLHDILDAAHFSSANIRVLIASANAGAARVVANSSATADAFVAVGGHPSLVRVIHNGIAAEPFDALGPGVRAEVRRSLGISDEAYVVGSFSRLHPWKGHRVLLDALATLSDVHALIVGGALFSGESDYEAELHARAARPEFAGRIHLLGARSDVPRLMAACDVIAHTSILPEPFGRVVVEALLAERPIIATDAGGVPEIVTNSVTGLLVPPGDAPRLAVAIRALRDDPSRASDLARAGAGDVRRRFTREGMVAAVAGVVDEVTGGAPR